MVPLTESSDDEEYVRAFYRTFRQAHRLSKRLVVEHIRPGDGHLRDILGFALENQTTSEYPFVFQYSFYKNKLDFDRGARLAAAVHLLQSSTLITDDVFDFADERYHQPAIHRRYDVSHAIIAAELFQSIAMECISSELKHHGVSNQVLALKLFHQIIKDLYVGQYLDVFSTSNVRWTTHEYRRVIELGAGCFFENLARCGALLGNKPKTHVESLAAYGYNYGMGLFVTDDIADIAQEGAVTGKMFAPDLQGRRMRLPMILALQLGEKKDTQWLKEFLRSKDNSRPVLLKAANRIKKSGALRVCQAVANDYVHRSIKSLASIAGSPTAKALAWLSQRLIRPVEAEESNSRISVPAAFRARG